MNIQYVISGIILLFLPICSSIAADNKVCNISTKALRDTPVDIGPRSRSEVMQDLSTPDFYDQIFEIPECSRVGKILLAITISSDGRAIHIEKLDSTFSEVLVEKHLFEIIPGINFGRINSDENSIVYVSLVFKGSFK
jgi:hypothetical protein